MKFRLPFPSPAAGVTFERAVQSVELWVVLFALLALLVGPRPYGLFSITMVFVCLGGLMLQDGAVEVPASSDNLKRSHPSTTNLANGAIGILLTLVVVGLARTIGTLLRDDEIELFKAI